MKSEIIRYEPYDFTHMWGIQLKATNGQILKQRKTQTQTTVWRLPEVRGVGSSKG